MFLVLVFLQYHQFTDTIKSASDKQLHNLWFAMSSMSQTVSAAGLAAQLASGASFPLVRVPMFEVPASQARQLSGVEFIMWSPLVKASQQDQWSKFARAESGWYEESKELGRPLSHHDEEHSDKETFNHHDDALAEYDTNSTMRPFIWRGDRSIDGHVEPVSGDEEATLAPSFLCSPPPYSPTYMNYDMMSEWYMDEMFPSLKQTRSGLMTAFDSSFANLPDSFAGVGFQNDFHDEYVIDVSDGAGDHPHSAFLQPVFADWHNETSEMVGFLTAIVAWDALFGSSLLPEGVKGIQAVLKNSCNQSYTYALHGRQVCAQTVQ
jgi:hypothetical protein